MIKERVGGERRPGLRPEACLTAIGLVFWLGGCSVLPDSMDPSEWAREIDRTFSSEEVAEDPAREARLRAERAVPIPGADAPFPNLASVPDEAPAVTTPEARDSIANALLADRANARYSDTTIPNVNGPDYHWTDLPPLEPLEAAPAEAEVSPQSSAEGGVAPTLTVELPPPLAASDRVPEVEDYGGSVGAENTMALVESMPRAPFEIVSARERAMSNVVVERVPVDQILLPQLPLSEAAEPTVMAAPAGVYEAPVVIERLMPQIAPIEPEKAAMPEPPAVLPEPPAVMESAGDIFPDRRVAEAVLSEQAGTGLGPRPGSRADPPIPSSPRSYDETFDLMFAASEPAPVEYADTQADIVGGTVAVTAAIGDTTPATAPFLAAEPMHVAVIYFNHGSAHLSKRDRNILDQIVESLRDYDGAIRIVGHASSRTRYNDIASHKLANYGMSVDRAQSVAETLIRRGIPRERVMVEAVSDGSPSNSEATPLGEAANRRADIYFEPRQRTF